jgi:hypothetical protein
MTRGLGTERRTWQIMHAHCIPCRMTNPRATLLARCIAVRAVLREDEAKAAARRAIGAPLEGYATSVPARRWRLHSIQRQLVRLRQGQERAAKRAWR